MKRIFSALLVLCMLVCLIPVQVMANEFDDIFDSGKSFYTVMVHKDGEYVPEIYDWWGAAAPGERVTLKTPPQHEQLLSGYKISKVEVWESDSDAPAQTGVNSFVMPDCGVDVLVFYTPVSGGGSDSGTDTQYNITRGTISNGNVLFSKDRAAAGTTITITPEPHRDYVLNSITVTDSKNQPVALTQKNGKYEFKMPTSDVRVDAYFVSTAVPAITVTLYHNDEANTVSSVQIPQGSGVAALPVPSYEGHLFLGWYTADNTEVSASTKFNQDTDLYAHWIRVAHTTDPDQNGFHANIDLKDEEILDKLVTEEDRASGEDIAVWLVVEEKSEDAVGAEDREAIVNKAGENKIAAHLNIQLFKRVGNETKLLTNTEKIPITMKLDENLIPSEADDVYIIYRHNGVVSTITKDVSYNKNTRELRFYAHEFSPYAIAYTMKTNNGGNAGVLDNVPRTGDISILMGGILMALWGAAMVAGVCVYGRKRAR